MIFLPRKIYQRLKNSFKQKEISLILGPRQAGKTTIMHKLSEELKSIGKLSAYFNLDILEDKQYFTTQHNLLDRIKKTVGEKPAVVFIDEIQRLDNSGLFLKGLYDINSPYKYVVSGSGSLELKSNILEPMTGRKIIFYCPPLSFSEFCAYKLQTDLNRTDKILAGSNPQEQSRIINEYINFGGYPRVVLAETYEAKTQILQEIYQSYLEKDIQLLLKVEKEESFSALVKILASQVGNILNRAALSSDLGVTEKTIKKYLYLLEKTFIIKLLKPYFRNVRKELKKSPKVYFVDLGLLRFAQGKVAKALPVEGNIFENACFLRLLELELFEEIKYWRTQSGAEVDFVISSPTTGKPIPVEVKTTFTGASIGRGLFSFFSHYNPDTAFIYSLVNRQDIKRKDVDLHVIPYHHLPKL